MSLQGKKINELLDMASITDETVIPGVFISGKTVGQEAQKITISQLKNNLNQTFCTKDEIEVELALKQDIITAGENVKLENNIISTTSYIAGEGISITKDAYDNSVISALPATTQWGSLTGNLEDQTDLKNALDNKQNILSAGKNITIQSNQISSPNSVQSLQVDNMVAMSKEDFDSLTTKDSKVLYLIYEDESE